MMIHGARIFSACLFLGYINPAKCERLTVKLNPSDSFDNGNHVRGLGGLHHVGNNGTKYPLGKCQGDCDGDHECAGDLQCFQRSGHEHVPGCGHDKPKYKGMDFCYDPYGHHDIDDDDDDDDGKPHKLGRCHGDSDSDDDCAGHLLCFHRSNTQDVPGCPRSLDKYPGVDFCYDPKNRGGHKLSIVGNNGGSGYPLGKCEGDCDSHDDCMDHLLCFQREGKEHVPGCIGDRPKLHGLDFCYDPSDA